MALFTALLLSVPVSAQAVRAQKLVAQQPPNILFVLADDQRWDTLRSYGNTSIRTPNLDRLAADGVRLDALYVAAPVCVASRAALLSGLSPHQNGVLNNGVGTPFPPALPLGIPTIATHLGSAGYVTSLIGKLQMGHPERWGFQEMPPTSGTDPRIHTEQAIDFIERHRDERWFLWLAYLDPHVPWQDPPASPYARSDIKPPPGWPPQQRLSDERWDLYYSEITNLDLWIGRLLGRIDELGLTRETFVFFMSDNGYLMGSHGLTGKERPLEESARVCAIARWPGRIRPGSTCAAPFTSTDFFATALSLAGVPKPPELECVSMLPAFLGKPPLRQWAYSECDQRDSPGQGHWQMIYQWPWKYVTYVDRPEEMLFDLASDPNELNDVVAQPGYEHVLEKMRVAHADWAAATP